MLNSDASPSKKHMILAYAVFDRRGVPLLRCAKIVNAKNPNPLLAEASALHLALCDLEEKCWLPVIVKIDNVKLYDQIKNALSTSSKELYDIIRCCKTIIDVHKMQHLVFWEARQANVVVDSLVQRAKREGKDVYGTDLDFELCQSAWAQMFGHFKPYLSKLPNTSKGRHTYLFSLLDALGQKLLSWLNLAMSKESMPREIIFEISTANGVRLVERYLMSISPASNNTPPSLHEDDMMHRLIDILNHLEHLPVRRTLRMYLQFEDEIKFETNDLFEPCSSDELTVSSNPHHFYYNVGAVQFEQHVVTLRVISHYAPGLCIRRLNFGSRKLYRGKDMTSTIMGWLHNRTIDDFKLIDILNEVNCKHVEDIEVTLIELVKKGMLVEMGPDLYKIKRKQLPQPIYDFIIEDLKYGGRKDDGKIHYNYKVVDGIDV